MTVSAPVDRSDIEAKLREINGEVHETAKTAAPIGLAIGAGLVVATVTLAFFIGRRRGRKRSTVVEIRRI